MHAEVDALRTQHHHSGRISADMLVVRITRTGKLAESRPCRKCILAMYTHPKWRIHTVIYSSDGTLKSERLSSMVRKILSAHVCKNKTL